MNVLAKTNITKLSPQESISSVFFSNSRYLPNSKDKRDYYAVNMESMITKTSISLIGKFKIIELTYMFSLVKLSGKLLLCNKLGEMG